MRVNYTDHALERMKERVVSKAEVEKTLAHGRKSDADDGLREAKHKISGYTLVVIFSIKSVQEVEVITAYWEDKCL